MRDHLPQARADFFLDVYAVVLQIPPGRVSTYGAIAEFLSRKGAARMVGYALNALPLHERDAVPAHRVVNRQGMLTGKAYFGTPERMQQLLKAEGIEVVADRVQDFDRLLWHPAQALWG